MPHRTREQHHDEAVTRPSLVSQPLQAERVEEPPSVSEAYAHRDFGLSHQVIWDFVSISNNLEDMRRAWAKLFGISGSQWLILMAIADLDQGNGVSVGDVSHKIHAVSTFVTTQTKILERMGLLNRVREKTFRKTKGGVRASPADKSYDLMRLSQHGADSTRWN